MQCSPQRVHATVGAAAAEMGLEVDIASTGKDPWILHRGRRLDYGPIYFRVDVDDIAGEPNRAAIAVYSAATGQGVIDNAEMMAKPGELAFRIATLALTGQR